MRRKGGRRAPNSVHHEIMLKVLPKQQQQKSRVRNKKSTEYENFHIIICTNAMQTIYKLYANGVVCIMWHAVIVVVFSCFCCGQHRIELENHVFIMHVGGTHKHEKWKWMENSTKPKLCEPSGKETKYFRTTKLARLHGWNEFRSHRFSARCNRNLIRERQIGIYSNPKL